MTNCRERSHETLGKHAYTRRAPSCLDLGSVAYQRESPQSQSSRSRLRQVACAHDPPAAVGRTTLSCCWQRACGVVHRFFGQRHTMPRPSTLISAALRAQVRGTQ